MEWNVHELKIAVVHIKTKMDKYMVSYVKVSSMIYASQVSLSCVILHVTSHAQISMIMKEMHTRAIPHVSHQKTAVLLFLHSKKMYAGLWLIGMEPVNKMQIVLLSQSHFHVVHTTWKVCKQSSNAFQQPNVIHMLFTFNLIHWSNAITKLLEI